MIKQNKKWLLLGFLTSFAVMAQPVGWGSMPPGEGMVCGQGGWCGQGGVCGGQGGWCGQGVCGGRMMETPLPAVVVRELKLSSQQVEKIEQLAENARKADQTLRATLQEAHEALRQVMAQPAPEESEVMAKLTEVSAASLALKKSHMKWVLALRRELNAAQWEKLQSAKFQRAHRGQHGRQPTCPF